MPWYVPSIHLVQECHSNDGNNAAHVAGHNSLIKIPSTDNCCCINVTSALQLIVNYVATEVGVIRLGMRVPSRAHT